MKGKSMGERKVFISHSAKDAEWARSFAEALKQRGVSVWFDEFDVQPGEALRDALEAGLRSSDVLVALLDTESSSKPNLFFELGAAISMGKRVISIVPKGIDPGALPLNIRLHRYLVRDTPEQTAEELSNTLQAA
jgi:nucleoside 2-deoxyribosyltransferase